MNNGFGTRDVVCASTVAPCVHVCPVHPSKLYIQYVCARATPDMADATRNANANTRGRAQLSNTHARAARGASLYTHCLIGGEGRGGAHAVILHCDL